MIMKVCVCFFVKAYNGYSGEARKSRAVSFVLLVYKRFLSSGGTYELEAGSRSVLAGESLPSNDGETLGSGVRLSSVE